MPYFFQQLLNALQLGSIYALIALGYTMVYGVLTMINFAHGDIFMLGAFVCFLGASVLRLPLPAVILLSFFGTALLGMTIERLAYRPLRSAPKVSAIITALGVGLFLENLTLAYFPYPQHVPQQLPNTVWRFGELSVSLLQLVIIASSLVLMLILDLLVRKTKFGTAMRAISVDHQSALLMGIPVNSIISLTFGLGAGLGGIAGVLYSLAFPVIDPYMGILVGWKAFISAVVGGIGNIRGAVIGGFLLASLEVAVISVAPSTFRDPVAFGLLLLLLLLRPQGILGKMAHEKV